MQKNTLSRAIGIAIGLAVIGLPLLIAMKRADGFKTESHTVERPTDVRGETLVEAWNGYEFRPKEVTTWICAPHHGRVGLRLETEDGRFDYIIAPNIASTLGIVMNGDAENLR